MKIYNILIVIFQFNNNELISNEDIYIKFLENNFEILHLTK